MAKSDRLTTTTIAAFAALTLLFLAAGVAVTWSGYEIQVRTNSIATDALPSIKYLTAAGDALRDMESSSEDYDESSPEKRAAARSMIASHWRRIDDNLTAYVALPAYPGERQLYEATVPPALREVNTIRSELLVEAELKPAKGAAVVTDADLRAATQRASYTLRNLVTFNAVRAEDEIERIAVIHRDAAWRSLEADIAVGVLAVPLVFLVLYRLREHDRLVTAHNALLAARAMELEVFGQRIAHDLLSPLSALSYCLSPFKRLSETDPKLKDALARARLCISRAQTMVHGVFDFSRAGGRPEPGARAELRPVLDSVVADVVSPELRDSLTIIIDPFEDCSLGCPAGVLTSVLSNLVANAVKFMSDTEAKAIRVRVRDKGGEVRVEVEDTGPGVPPGLETRIFEPYVRAEGVTQRGLGLGLATVKRFCEAYGGEVGVRSALGHGSVFWFTMPKAAPGTPSMPPLDEAHLGSLN